MAKRTVGIVEKVKLIGEKEKEALAVFDTGARQTSIDIDLAAKVGLGPVVRIAKVKNPSVKQSFTRPVVKAILEIKGQRFEAEANIQDRSHMKFPLIIGRNVLAGSFVVDPEINMELFKQKKKERKG